MAFILEYWIAILGVALLLLGYVVLILIPQLRENDTKNIYQHAGEPKILFQTSELQKNFWADYDRECMRYRDSGNKWAARQTPVIPFPMNSAWEFQWFGHNYHVSTVGLSYTEYLMAGIRFYSQMRAIWDKEIYTAFGVKELMEKSKQQQPVNPDKLWQNVQN